MQCHCLHTKWVLFRKKNPKQSTNAPPMTTQSTPQSFSVYYTFFYQCYENISDSPDFNCLKRTIQREANKTEEKKRVYGESKMKLLKIQIFFRILRFKMIMSIGIFKITTIQYSVVQNHFYGCSKTTTRFYISKNIHATGNCSGEPNDERIRFESESTGLSFLST